METEEINSENINPPEGIHPDTLEQKNPWILTQLIYLVTQLMANYGWFLLIGAMICLYLRKHISNWLKKQQEAKEAAEYHKNPDKFIEKEQRILQARLKMQEEYDKAAEEYNIKLKQREEEKREARLKLLERHEKGERMRENNSTNSCDLNTSSSLRSENKDKNRKPRLRPEFNPMMSHGSSGYRPARRGGAGGG